MEFSNLNNNEFWKKVRECDDYQFLREELHKPVLPVDIDRY